MWASALGRRTNSIFAERLEELNEELEALKVEARSLEEQIAANVADLLAV